MFLVVICSSQIDAEEYRSNDGKVIDAVSYLQLMAQKKFSIVGDDALNAVFPCVLVGTYEQQKLTLISQLRKMKYQVSSTSKVFSVYQPNEKIEIPAKYMAVVPYPVTLVNVTTNALPDGRYLLVGDTTLIKTIENLPYSCANVRYSISVRENTYSLIDGIQWPISPDEAPTLVLHQMRDTAFTLKSDRIGICTYDTVLISDYAITERDVVSYNNGQMVKTSIKENTGFTIQVNARSFDPVRIMVRVKDDDANRGYTLSKIVNQAVNDSLYTSARYRYQTKRIGFPILSEIPVIGIAFRKDEKYLVKRTLNVSLEVEK